MAKASRCITAYTAGRRVASCRLGISRRRVCFWLRETPPDPLACTHRLIPLNRSCERPWCERLGEVPERTVQTLPRLHVHAKDPREVRAGTPSPSGKELQSRSPRLFGQATLTPDGPRALGEDPLASRAEVPLAPLAVPAISVGPGHAAMAAENGTCRHEVKKRRSTSHFYSLLPTHIWSSPKVRGCKVV